MQTAHDAKDRFIKDRLRAFDNFLHGGMPATGNQHNALALDVDHENLFVPDAGRCHRQVANRRHALRDCHGLCGNDGRRAGIRQLLRHADAFRSQVNLTIAERERVVELPLRSAGVIKVRVRNRDDADVAQLDPQLLHVEHQGRWIARVLVIAHIVENCRGVCFDQIGNAKSRRQCFADRCQL